MKTRKMFHMTTVLLSLLLICVKDETEMATCGRLGPRLLTLITNTRETNHHWPWHAAIYHTYSKASQPTYKCGGTVISSKFILTAAHCVTFSNEKFDTTNISISLGRLNLDVSNENSAQSIEVAEIIVHEDYNSIDYVHDIAIIKLSTDAKFNNYVKPICLWNSHKTDISEVIGKFGTVIGWGLTEDNQVSKVLRETVSPVVWWDTCLKSNPAVFGSFLSRRNYCAGLLNGTVVCQGDSGGSMTFEENGIYYIRGIVSALPAKINRETQQLECDSSQYAIFTDVAQYLTWIRENTLDRTCETTVQCFFRPQIRCSIDVDRSDQNCKIIFDEVVNPDVVWLSANGNFDVVPDMSNAVTKFDVEDLNMAYGSIKIVQRSKLSAFGKKLTKLNLEHNEIAQLNADTFDDLKNLRELYLQNNYLRELHRDLFKELAFIERLDIYSNLIEILPAGLFRNNNKLVAIFLLNNKLKKIEFQFNNLPNLEVLYLTANVCIDEACQFNMGCSGFDRINDVIRRNCSH